MSRVPPTYSGSVSRPAYDPHEHEGHDHHIPNRKERRSHRQRHNPLFTSGNVWHRWDRLNEAGLLVRFERIAKRRGKSKRWAENRLARFMEEQRTRVREYNIWLKEQMAKLQEEASGTDIGISTDTEPGGGDGDTTRST